MLNFVRTFLYIYCDDHITFILQFFNVVCYTDLLVDVEPSIYPWDKSHLITVYNLFNVLLNLIC